MGLTNNDNEPKAISDNPAGTHSTRTCNYGIMAARDVCISGI